jgi:hypothetical protein
MFYHTVSYPIRTGSKDLLTSHADYLVCGFRICKLGLDWTVDRGLIGVRGKAEHVSGNAV